MGDRIRDDNLLQALASIESIYPYTLYTIRNDYTLKALGILKRLKPDFSYTGKNNRFLYIRAFLFQLSTIVDDSFIHFCLLTSFFRVKKQEQTILGSSKSRTLFLFAH